MSSPTVRTGRQDDLDFLVAANRAMADETEGKRLDPAPLDAGVRAALADPERGRYYLAEVAGERAGCLLLTREWSDWRNRWFWWIQSVWVAPRFRGRGVYRALYERVRADAGAGGEVAALRLYVDRANQRAQAVYARLGMRRSHYDLMEEDLSEPAAPG